MTDTNPDAWPGGPHQPPLIPLRFEAMPPDQSRVRARQFFERMDQRRSVRHFSDRDVPKEVVMDLIRAASTAPSGAHKQPWTFAAVSDRATKARIRQAAEEEERLNYQQRMPAQWLEALEPFATDWHKPFLEVAPWLVVVFQHTVELLPSGETRKNYYVAESVGIAVGLFLAAVHQAGLVALTHTPSPMKFLSEILNRPPNEKPFVLIPVGYPAADCEVPDLRRKELEEVAVFI